MLGEHEKSDQALDKMNDVCLPFIAISLALAISCNATSTANRRQLLTDSASQETYFNPTPLVLPAPYIDPAPIVLPSDVIDNAGDVETVGVIQPAPQIQPAPVILPSNAIKEKDRAYPMDKRNGLTEPQLLPQPPFLQTVQAALPLQPQLVMPQSLQPVNGLTSLPVLSNLGYQGSPLTGGVIPVQSMPRTVTGQSRQSIPVMSEYRVEDEYHPYRRRLSHRWRSSRRKQYPYDSYSSFEETYGKSPGIFDDLKDISTEMNNYLDDKSYRHNQREWVEDGYDRIGERRRHHYRHHRRPSHRDYSDDEPNDTSLQRMTGYTDDEAPRKGIDVNPVDSPGSQQVEADPKEEESLHDDDEATENAVKQTKPKEVKQTTTTHLEKEKNDEVAR
ncbi:hypothetical protein QZH41_006229 [Actinostola sp. cb2023]|nr:hypothetical protein QZH41_006229 [Actinostola sp. cb2023]